MDVDACLLEQHAPVATRSDYRTPSLPQTGRQVLGSDLNRSESRRVPTPSYGAKQTIARQGVPGDRRIPDFGPAAALVYVRFPALIALGKIRANEIDYVVPEMPRSAITPSTFDDWSISRKTGGSFYSRVRWFCFIFPALHCCLWSVKTWRAGWPFGAPCAICTFTASSLSPSFAGVGHHVSDRRSPIVRNRKRETAFIRYDGSKSPACDRVPAPVRDPGPSRPGSLIAHMSASSPDVRGPRLRRPGEDSRYARK